jgi:taurine dioxygenase
MTRVTEFVVNPMTPTFGAEIAGIDLSARLSEDILRDLESELLKWKVLFFRNQKIGIEDQKRLGSWFGKLEVHPTARHNPEVVRIEEDDKRRANNNLWHSDMSFKVEPPLGSILKAEEIPDVGGDTLFADMEQAYQGLSNEIKERIDCAHALHCWPSAWIDLAMRSAGISDRDEFLRQCPDPEHPVVRSHPKTGNKSLYVNTAFTRRIIGMSKTESDELLTKLYQQAAIPEYQCRFRWQTNSVAFWDNRCTQHYAVADFFPNRRIVERITICGDVPL